MVYYIVTEILPYDKMEMEIYMSPYLGYLNLLSDWTTIFYIIPCILIAFWAHGVSHARKLKKYNAFADKENGFTWNPLKYVDIMGLVFMCGIGYGWGKTRKADLKKLNKKQKVLVYLAGPLGNFAMAVVSVVIQAVFLIFFLNGGIHTNPVPGDILYFFNILTWVNLIMFATHILPIPGFNGYNIIKTLFFERCEKKWLIKLEESGKLIFLALAIYGGLLYAAEIPVSYISSILAAGQEWFVDLVTGGLFSGSTWTPKS